MQENKKDQWCTWDHPRLLNSSSSLSEGRGGTHGPLPACVPSASSTNVRCKTTYVLGLLWGLREVTPGEGLGWCQALLALLNILLAVSALSCSSPWGSGINHSQLGPYLKNWPWTKANSAAHSWAGRIPGASMLFKSQARFGAWAETWLHCNQTPWWLLWSAIQILPLGLQLLSVPSAVSPLLPKNASGEDKHLAREHPSILERPTSNGWYVEVQGVFRFGPNSRQLLKAIPASEFHVDLIEMHHWDFSPAGLLPPPSPSSFPSLLWVLLPRAPLITSCMPISKSESTSRGNQLGTNH